MQKNTNLFFFFLLLLFFVRVLIIIILLLPFLYLHAFILVNLFSFALVDRRVVCGLCGGAEKWFNRSLGLWMIVLTGCLPVLLGCSW